MPILSFRCVTLALCGLALGFMLSGCDTKPDAADQARAACEATFGPLDWDVMNSMSWRHSVTLEKLSCGDQHSLLKLLAGMPKDSRDEWLDEQAQNVRENPPASD